MIRKLSKKRASQNRVYLKKRKDFLEGKFCPVTGQEANQIHHTDGRIGSLLLDETKWLAVSAEGHNWIHNNVVEAQKKGWIK